MLTYHQLRSSGIHLRAIPPQLLELSITKISLKITYLKLHSNLLGANELNSSRRFKIIIIWLPYQMDICLMHTAWFFMMMINTCHAEFILENVYLRKCLYFLSFLKTVMLQRVEILPHERQELGHPMLLIPLLLMPWWCKESGHQLLQAMVFIYVLPEIYILGTLEVQNVQGDSLICSEDYVLWNMILIDFSSLAPGRCGCNSIYITTMIELALVIVILYISSGIPDRLITWNLIDSIWPSDAIWQHRSGSLLAQVKACWLTAPTHWLNQCFLWHLAESNFTRSAHDL